MKSLNLGQHFAAISDYDIAIRLKPDYAEHTTIEDLRSKLGQYFAALLRILTSLSTKPDFARCIRNRGGWK